MEGTLVFDATEGAAALVTTAKGKQTAELRRFKSAQAALEWCERNHCKFIYLPPVTLGEN